MGGDSGAYSDSVSVYSNTSDFPYYDGIFTTEPWALGVSTVLVIIFSTLSSSAGIGGGGLHVPLYTFVLGTGVYYASPLSTTTICGAALGKNVVSIRRRHPERVRPLINYQLGTFIMISEVLGTVIGVILHSILPAVVKTIILAVVLSYSAYEAWAKGAELTKKETIQAQLKKAAKGAGLTDRAGKSSMIASPRGKDADTRGFYMAPDAGIELTVMEEDDDENSPSGNQHDHHHQQHRQQRAGNHDGDDDNSTDGDGSDGSDNAQSPPVMAADGGAGDGRLHEDAVVPVASLHNGGGGHNHHGHHDHHHSREEEEDGEGKKDLYRAADVPAVFVTLAACEAHEPLGQMYTCQDRDTPEQKQLQLIQFFKQFKTPQAAAAAAADKPKNKKKNKKQEPEEAEEEEEHADADEEKGVATTPTKKRGSKQTKKKSKSTSSSNDDGSNSIDTKRGGSNSPKSSPRVCTGEARRHKKEGSDAVSSDDGSDISVSSGSGGGSDEPTLKTEQAMHAGLAVAEAEAEEGEGGAEQHVQQLAKLQRKMLEIFYHDRRCFWWESWLTLGVATVYILVFALVKAQVIYVWDTCETGWWIWCVRARRFLFFSVLLLLFPCCCPCC